MRLLLPKTYVPLDELTRPVIFLAGPIKGGGEWQETACELLMQKQPDITIAAPRRWDETHRFADYRQPGTADYFDRQTTWERYYLEEAARGGCIVFWLPCESKVAPRQDGPYARDTYGELGEWRARYCADRSVRLVIGAEPDFPGLSVIKRNYDDASGEDFPIYPTLEATIEAALARCHC